MFTAFMHSSREFQAFLCERAAIGANKKSSSGSRNLKLLAKKNRHIIGDYIEDAIKTLSAVYLMDKPASMVLEIASIKGLFMWFLDNADELENNDSLQEFQLAKRILSIFNQDYKKLGDRLSAEVVRIEELENKQNEGREESIRNTSFENWYSIIDDMCLTIVWAWGKCRFVPNIQQKCDINTFAYRFMLYLTDRLYYFAWSFSYKQLNEYREFIYQRIQNGLEYEDDERFLDGIHNRINCMTHAWDYSSLIRECDIRDGTEKDVIFDEKACFCDDDDNEQKKVQQMKGSLRMLLEGLFSDGNCVHIGDLIKPGITPTEMTALTNALQNGLFLFPEYAKECMDIQSNEDLINDPFNRHLFEYIQQTVWDIKIIYRVTTLAIYNMRQLVLQQYYLKDQAKPIPTKKAISQGSKNEAAVSELQERIKQLEQENARLYEKNSSLMRKNNRLISELEQRNSDTGIIQEDIEDDETSEADFPCADFSSEKSDVQCEEKDEDWVGEVNRFAEKHSVVIVGGNDNLLKNISREMPKISLIYNSRSTSTDNLISHADIVFFRYSSLPHSVYNRVRKTCTSYDVPYEYLPDSTAIHLLAKDMCQKIKSHFTE